MILFSLFFFVLCALFHVSFICHSTNENNQHGKYIKMMYRLKWGKMFMELAYNCENNTVCCWTHNWLHLITKMHLKWQKCSNLITAPTNHSTHTIHVTNTQVAFWFRVCVFACRLCHVIPTLSYLSIFSLNHCKQIYFLKANAPNVTFAFQYSTTCHFHIVNSISFV